MYFPLLRGKQNELIALRELLEEGRISDNILPIIEPIKITSTLLSTLDLFIKDNRKIAIIINPILKNFSDNIDEILEDEEKVKLNEQLQQYYEFLESDNIIEAYYSDENIYSIAGDNSLIIWNDTHSKYYEEDKSIENNILYNLRSNKSIIKRKIEHNAVAFEDNYEKEARNLDYYEKYNNFYSSNHISELTGDSQINGDYSIVGADFKEEGFAPSAVAIHIVHFDEDDSLLISHFVSESNVGIKNPQKKYREALEKLIKWNDNEKLTTYGISKFVESYDKNSYPGLGAVKKFSIMHHIEMMDSFYSK